MTIPSVSYRNQRSEKSVIAAIVVFDSALFLFAVWRKDFFMNSDIILKAEDLYFSYDDEQSHSLNGLSLN